MAAELTLDNVRQVMREEIVAERVHTRQLVHEEILAERDHTRQLVHEGISSVMQTVDTLRHMLEEDARAESTRLDRVGRRSLRTKRLLAKHIAGHSPKAV